MIGGLSFHLELIYFIFLFGIVTILAFWLLPLKRWQNWLVLNVVFESLLFMMFKDSLSISLIRFSSEIIGGAFIYYFIDYMLKAHESKKLLERNATQDSLTHLYNAGYYSEAVRRLFAKAERGKGDFSLLAMDIDHFKQINDTYGHPVGDRVLIELAGILKASFSAQHGIVCRIGGEEFAVLIPYRSFSEVARAAEQFHEAVRQHTFLADRGAGSLRLTVSAGICFYSCCSATPHSMYDKADHALYRAKRKGRDQICYADELKAKEYCMN
jgi:diguanylate cyclase